MASRRPGAKDAAAIVTTVLKDSVRTVRRFPTGSHHFVYDIETEGGRRLVARLSRREDIEAAQGAIYWSQALRPRKVPLPELLYADLGMIQFSFPYLLLQRLPGDDLARAYDALSAGELRSLAVQLAEVQARVTSLPVGKGYGYVTSQDGPFAHRTWRAVIAASIDRSRARIRSAGVVDERVVDALEAAAARCRYLDRVAATPFLHDITTKNVIIHQGRMSGIVDVDDLCFGDPLLLAGLIRMALWAHGHDQSYVAMWLEILRPDAEQRAALDLYTLQCCVDFMGEIGQRFNRSEVTVAPTYLSQLQAIHAELTQRVLAW